MKQIAFLIVLALFTLAGYSQNPFRGFWRPVQTDEIGSLAAGTGTFLFRPVIEVTAIQMFYDKELKNFHTSSLKSMGMGLSYSHFITVNDAPYNNWGLNALLLFDATPTETNESALSGALSVTALQLVSIGIGYNFGIDKPFILTGIVYNFNK